MAIIFAVFSSFENFKTTFSAWVSFPLISSNFGVSNAAQVSRPRIRIEQITIGPAIRYFQVWLLDSGSGRAKASRQQTIFPNERNV